MIDIHCHILPGVDDGSRDMAESLAMARLAVVSGITTTVCTPHQFDGRYDNSREKILGAVRALREALEREGIPLKLVAGGEVHLHPELLERVDRGEVMTYGDQGKAILLELPHHMIPPGTEEAIFGLQTRRLTVVLAHPERNRDILRKPERLKGYVDRGVIPQVTQDSLTGDFGPEVKRLAERIVKEHAGTVLVATDAHRGEGRRVPKLTSGLVSVPWI